MFTETAFWVCLVTVVYVYAGYPVVVFIFARICRRHVVKAGIEPTVTVVIAAYNEENEVEHTVLNKLTQDYPPERLDVIVVSDGSTDRTDDIVKDLAETHNGRLSLLRQEPRQGKTHALNFAVKHAVGDILVFSDANSVYAPDAVRQIVGNFADSSVGYVTGQMVYTNPEESGVSEGSGTYMRYENWIRSLETQLGSIVGVDGGIDAVRRNQYVPMRSDQLPDFVLPLSVIEQGKRVVYEPHAIVYEPALSAAANEFRMRVRVTLRALWAISDKRRLLNLARYPLFAWQLLSHKLLRYLAFIPLAGLMVSNASLISDHYFYRLFFVVQTVSYLLAALGHQLKHSARIDTRLLVPYYFVILNAACAFAVWKFLNRQKLVLWTPRGGA